MVRTYTEISPEEFKRKVEKLLWANDYIAWEELPDKLPKDFKVDFDWENCVVQPSSYDQSDPLNPLMGIRILNHPSGVPLVVWGIIAGGDWESPVYFILYWSGKSIRAYIPEKGNCWNTKTKKAYGNDDEADYENMKKRKILYEDIFPQEFDASSWADLNPDDLLKDIFERLSPVQLAQPTGDDVIKQKGKRKVNKGEAVEATNPLDRPPLSERVEALKYYGTGDEGVELFQQLCGTIYSLNGLGQTLWAEMVFLMAEEFAQDSYKWAVQEGEDLKDFVHGRYN